MVQSGSCGLWGRTFMDWVCSSAFIRAVYGEFGVYNQRLWHFFLGFIAYLDNFCCVVELGETTALGSVKQH